MARDLAEYFADRARAEAQLAAAATHPAVRRTHEEFAAVYRAYAGPKKGSPADRSGDSAITGGTESDGPS